MAAAAAWIWLLVGIPGLRGASAGEVPPVDPAEPSVDVVPATIDPRGPNRGLWFVVRAAAGQAVTVPVRVVNPATVPQRVRLQLAELDFGPDGAPRVVERGTDVSTWGTFARPELVVPPGGEVLVDLTVTVPEGAAPGDHVGAIVARTTGGTGPVTVEKVVATRLYVTVAGDARPDVTVESVRAVLDDRFWPRRALVTVLVRNTGRVGLETRVTVDGREATGASLLMTESVEPYTAVVDVPPWGGLVRLPVEVTTRLPGTGTAGPARTTVASVLVVPWHLVAGAAGAGTLLWVGARAWRRRRSRLDRLAREVARIERILAEHAVTVAGTTTERWAPSPRDALVGALRRAERAGDTAAAEELRRRLAALDTDVPHPAPAAPPSPDTPSDALGAILSDLATAHGRRRDALVEAARAYGPAALRTHSDAIARLPPEVRARLLGAPPGRHRRRNPLSAPPRPGDRSGTGP